MAILLCAYIVSDERALEDSNRKLKKSLKRWKQKEVTKYNPELPFKVIKKLPSNSPDSLHINNICPTEFRKI